MDGYLNLAWSTCTILICCCYNPYQSCKYCRGGRPPGLVMVPYSLGVAIMTQHIISVLLGKLPAIPCIFIQLFLGLAAKNYSTIIWIEIDKFVLKRLSSLTLTEEEILYYWWYIMVTIGTLIVLVSLIFSTCSKSHICFKSGIQIKPWTCYWNRLVNKKVNFIHSVAIIPHMEK